MDVAPTVDATVDTTASAPDARQGLLLSACRMVIGPLARLAVARGLRYADIDEIVRSAFVAAARDAHPHVPAQRSVSRVSAATGLNRREVDRLINTVACEGPRRSPATELFTRWVAEAEREEAGSPPSLPRQGAAPSFEALAQAVTKDVHPRTLLEELCRLGLVKLEAEGDRVVLLKNRFVPDGRDERLFGFLGANVGDHLSAAVDNVVAERPRHLEQALFADELSCESVERLKPLVSAQWQGLVRDLAPVVQQLIDDDKSQDRPRERRVRIGLYAFDAAMGLPPPAAAEPAAAEAAGSHRTRRRKKKA